MSKIEEKIECLVKPIIEKLSYKLYDVEYSKEGKDYYLRIFIDNNDVISIEDCEIVTNAISDILDEANYIKEQYFLEVSSPGIERRLRKDEHFEDNIGKDIEISLFKKDNYGNKQYIGCLISYTNETITISINNNLKSIERKDISFIKTIYNW